MILGLIAKTRCVCATHRGHNILIIIPTRTRMCFAHTLEVEKKEEKEKDAGRTNTHSLSYARIYGMYVHMIISAVPCGKWFKKMRTGARVVC